MVRLTRKVFTDLAIYMIGLGVLVGLILPPFVTLMGVPTDPAIFMPNARPNRRAAVQCRLSLLGLLSPFRLFPPPARTDPFRPE